MYSIYFRSITTALLFTAAAAPACDAVDDDSIQPSDDDLLADADPADHDEADHDAVARLDELAAAPDPAAGYLDCPASASFCFWTQIQYGGYPFALPKGDFAIQNFGTPIRSLLKRGGTYRVKVFSKPHFQGSCAVFGPPDKYADSPNFAFGVLSARRMEPHEGGC